MTPGNAVLADPVEERGASLYRIVHEKHEGTLKPESVSTKQERIAELARNNPKMALFTLAHFMDYEWVKYAYDCTRKDGAVGVDGQTGEDYAANLERNLTGLIDRLKSGSYRAPPVRRHYIDKADGSGQRGLGIPSFEDKVAQRAIVLLLEPIYENDFSDSSYGYRRGRNAHGALQAIRNGITKNGGRWVLDVDVRKFFDSIPHTKLREFLARRVTDGVVRKLIDKWLKAGVLENGQMSFSDEGAPQGGVASPLLANIFLHYVLDEWFSDEVRPRLRGPRTLVRFADDLVMLFAYKDDAERVLGVLGKRLGKYGLELHPDKTSMVDFRYKPKPSKDGDNNKMVATNFNFLGFTHVWVKSRQGKPVVRQLTAKDRLARAKKAINQQCRKMRHWPVRDQHQKLCRMLTGHFAYFGISGNIRRLGGLAFHAENCWRKWLSRRSSKSNIPWAAFKELLKRFPLPQARIVHGYTRTCVSESIP
jgi:RNA-directed DNA polymerase